MRATFDWTDEAIQKMLDLHARGKSAGEIARVIGHSSRVAVISKLRGERDKASRRALIAAGIKPPGSACKWTAEEDEILRANAHLGGEEIARLTHRTVRAVHKRSFALKIRLPSRSGAAPENRWTEGEKDILRQNYHLGVARVSQLTRRSISGVRKQMAILGLRLRPGGQPGRRRPDVAERNRLAARAPKKSSPWKDALTEPQRAFEPLCVPYVENGPKQCAWIIGEPSDLICCGLPVHAGSFCLGHGQLVYNPDARSPSVRVPTKTWTRLSV